MDNCKARCKDGISWNTVFDYRDIVEYTLLAEDNGSGLASVVLVADLILSRCLDWIVIARAWIFPLRPGLQPDQEDSGVFGPMTELGFSWRKGRIHGLR